MVVSLVAAAAAAVVVVVVVSASVVVVVVAVVVVVVVVVQMQDRLKQSLESIYVGRCGGNWVAGDADIVSSA